MSHFENQSRDRRSRAAIVAYALAAVWPVFCIVTQFDAGIASVEDVVWTLVWTAFLVVCAAQVLRPSLFGWVIVLSVSGLVSFFSIARDLSVYEVTSPGIGLWQGWPVEALFLAITATTVSATVLVALVFPRRRAHAT